MEHVGDITKLKGSELPIVDIITGGSPCQDLSVAGKRAGLAGERSGLFMEQIRLIKELREHDRANRGTDVDFRLLRPRYMVWENVPGAFSSNNGEDFRAVLEETARVVDKDAVIPRPAKKWSNAGTIMGDGWSIAWRVHDAQFWGVPQRRKRISLVADFGGESAPEILFERKSLSGDIEESGEEREETTGTNDSSTEKTIYWLQGNGINRDVKNGCGGRGWRQNECYTLNTIDVPAVIIFDPRSQDGAHRIYENIFPTLNTAQGGQRQPCISNGAEARRITPKEAERLQGFPDGWTDIGEWIDSKGKKHKDADSAKYKALGNSIALPFWEWMAKRMVSHIDHEDITMASLFDGIGGFPLVFSRAGVNPVWASEIEEFPIAVTKVRFPDGNDEAGDMP